MARGWPRGRLVEVEWVDSASTNGWHRPDDLTDDDGTIMCRSVGYIFKQDRSAVSLVQSQSTHGSVAERISIPRSCVRSIKPLVRGQ